MTGSDAGVELRQNVATSSLCNKNRKRP